MTPVQDQQNPDELKRWADKLLSRLGGMTVPCGFEKIEG